MNLGFPINSTRDELLLLPGSDLGMLMFFSNRQGGDSLVTVSNHGVIGRVAMYPEALQYFLGKFPVHAPCF